jgi:hypothetical protein
LYNRVVSRQATVFSGSFFNPLVQALLDAGIEEENIKFVYDYATRYSAGLITSDADRISQDGGSGMYFHSFEMGAADRGRVITLTQRTPNVPVWSIIALAVGCLAAGIFFIKNKGDKNHGQERYDYYISE